MGKQNGRMYGPWGMPVCSANLSVILHKLTRLPDLKPDLSHSGVPTQITQCTSIRSRGVVDDQECRPPNVGPTIRVIQNDTRLLQHTERRASTTANGKSLTSFD